MASCNKLIDLGFFLDPSSLTQLFQKLTHLNLEKIPSTTETKEWFFTLEDPLDHHHHLKKNPIPNAKSARLCTAPKTSEASVFVGKRCDNLQASTICCDDFKVEVF